MDRADIDGVTLEFDDSGTGEPVVFIHGAFIADAFRPLLAQPTLPGYRLITYRRRGYGDSTRTEGPISAERQAADCLGLVRWLDLDRAHVVGHSYGGDVALQLALDAPQAVRSLALLEPALFVGASARPYRESLLRSTERSRVEGAATVMEQFFRVRWPGYSRTALEQALPGGFERALQDAPATFELDVGFTDWHFGEAEARRVAQPTLVILGGDSPPLDPRFDETYQFLLQWLPNARGLVLPGATHFFMLENEQVAAALAAALAEHWQRC
jgi:pimeloyl-ACP methyl ester carboxylesterase